MHDVFRTERLTPQRARLAFHLVRLSEPHWTLLDWRALTRRLCRRSADRAGLMAVQDRRGVFHALYGYIIDDSLKLGRCLRVGDLILAQLPGTSIEEAIVASAERLAASLACDALVIDLPTDRTSPASRRLRAIIDSRFTPISVAHRRRAVEADQCDGAAEAIDGEPIDGARHAAAV